jgi:hypothetical protein
MIHGVGLAVERLFNVGSGELSALAKPIAVLWLQRMVIFSLVGLSWIFFRADSVADAFTFLAGIAQWQWRPEYGVAFRFLAFFSLVIFLFDLRVEHHREEYIFQSNVIGGRITVGIALALLTFLFGANQSSAFIYFQF